LKIWQKAFSILLALIVTVLAWANYEPEEPDQCAICDHIKCHAPCLVNLSTGEIDELALYEPHFYKVGDIADEQPGGTFSFISAAGLRGYKLTAPWEIHISIPKVGDRIDKAHFCAACRDRLRDINRGYVLVDLYIPSAPVIYPIAAGFNEQVRCYTASIAQPDDGAYELKITGNHESK